MDDSSLMDLYEDLSLDKIYKMTTQTLPLSYTKPEPEEEDSKIDLFMEALTVHTIDKVQSQLSELQKENQKLRCENAELRESKKQLCKNISSLFLTAKQEILKKDQEIAKLRNERLQENCESCRTKQVQHDLKQPLDKIPSSVNKSTVCAKKDKPQSEIRNKLMQEISQSYSLSSCQGVASRKKQKGDVCDLQTVHKHGNSNILPEPEIRKTTMDDLKSSEERKVAGSKQDTCIKNCSTKYFSSTSDHQQQPLISTCGFTATKESPSLNLKNKRTIPDVETQRVVKARKVETSKINLIKNSAERTEKIARTKHVEKKCSSHFEHLSHHESLDLSSSSQNNSEPVIAGHVPKRPKHFMFVGTSEHDKAVCDIPNRSTWSYFQGTFVSEETTENDSRKSTYDSDKYTNNSSSLQPHIPQIYQSAPVGLVSSANIDTISAETADGQGRADNHFRTNKGNCHFNSDFSLTSVKTSVLGETGRDFTRNVTSTSFLKDCSHTAVRTDNQALPNGNDTAGSAKTSCNQWKKIMAVGHDQNSNCSSNESLGSQGAPSDDNGLNDSRDELLFSVDNAEPTYITCTSNLILLGDEETTCTTFTSPCKLQPSEFYPPGVRGCVHEGGSHARHIRGITEVIKKVPVDKFTDFPSEPKNEPLPYRTPDESIQIKDSTSDNINSKKSCESDSLNCHKINKSEIIHSIEPKDSLSDKTDLNVHTSDSLKETIDGTAEYTNTSQKVCGIPDEWTNAVNYMFGTVFHTKLCALKQEPVHPVLKKISKKN